MFSDNRYSITRYSIGTGERDIAIQDRYFDTFSGLIGLAVLKDAGVKFHDVFSGKADGTLSILTGISGYTEPMQVTTMNANVVVAESMGENVGVGVYGSKNIHVEDAVSIGTSYTVLGSKNIPDSMTEHAGFGTDAWGCKNIVTGEVASVSLFAIGQGTSQITDTATFQITIPPGGELRIDSDVFSVLLNGENALHTQAGEWINVSPELLRVSVETATGGPLDGRLIYTERFL